MAITYHAGRRIQGLSTDTFPPADFTEDFSEATPTTWTEDSYGGSYDAHLEPYSGSINRLFFDMDYTSVESTSGTLDLANASLLGSNVSDTKWVMRFRINFSNLSSNGTIWVGLSDNAGASNVAQRFVGCRLKADSGFSCGADNGGAAMTTTNATNGGSTSISTSTDYYVTVERKSETLNTSTIRTGSHTGTVLGTGDDTSISSSQDDLRYWKVMNHLASGGGNVRGYLYDLEIYDGISSVSAVKPTNVQAGSRFEETDTRKMYHYNQATGVEQLVGGSERTVMTNANEAHYGISVRTGSALIGISISKISFRLRMYATPTSSNLVYCRLWRGGSFIHTFGSPSPSSISVGSTLNWYSFGTGGDFDGGNGTASALQAGDRLLISWDRGGAYNSEALAVEYSNANVYDSTYTCDTVTTTVSPVEANFTDGVTRDVTFKIIGLFPKVWEELGT